MKYYLFEVTEGADSVKGRAVYEYDKRNDAIASFHGKLASAMRSPLFKREQLMVINSANGVECAEVYDNEEYVELGTVTE